MPIRLKWLVTLVAAFAIALVAIALFAYPLRASIRGTEGLLFWTLVTLLAGAAPVRMPGGAIVSVTIAPLLASAVLGGPAAAAIVGVVGTTEWRELRGLAPGRGGIPWYGTLYNHSSVVAPLIVAGFIYEVMAGVGFGASGVSLAAVVVSGLVYFALNNVLTALAIAFREGRPAGALFTANVRQFGVSLAGLAPLAWLMGVMYTTAGWIGVVPFALPLYTTRAAYEKVVEIRDMFTQTVKSLASAVDAKDPYTAGHSVRVQVIAKDIGQEMGCTEDELEALEWGGLLHDIGKIGIPDAILLKQGSLTRQERIVMNGHPVKGEEIIRPVAKLKPELPIIRHHHEWYNGSGYPDHLIGEGIPRLARIMHVADAYEAMTAARPYRMTPLTEEQALGELRRFIGVQFDPEVVAAFEKVFARGPEWTKPTAPPPTHRTIPLLGEAEPEAQAA
jgi:HD-GYP domain-containing protein (c-di-GMP phosphodiesterase class II)